MAKTEEECLAETKTKRSANLDEIAMAKIAGTLRKEICSEIQKILWVPRMSLSSMSYYYDCKPVVIEAGSSVSTNLCHTFYNLLFT